MTFARAYLKVVRDNLINAQLIIDAISSKLGLRPNCLRIRREAITWGGDKFCYENAMVDINHEQETKIHGESLDPADPEIIDKIRALVTKAESESVQISCTLNTYSIIR